MSINKLKKNAFPKEVRITNTKDYKLCYEEGIRLYSKRFIVFVRHRNHDGIGIRVGVGISKKIGKAVLRNRLKRLIKEFIRLNRGLVKRDLDVVIVPKKGIDIKALKYKDVEQELYPLIFTLKEIDFSKKSSFYG